MNEIYGAEVIVRQYRYALVAAPTSFGEKIVWYMRDAGANALAVLPVALYAGLIYLILKLAFRLAGVTIP